MYAEIRGPKVKWGAGHHCPSPLATTLMASQAKCDIVFKLFFRFSGAAVNATALTLLLESFARNVAAF